MSKKLIVGLLLVIVLTGSYFSFQAKAIHSIGGGCSYIGEKEDDGAYSIAVTTDLGFAISGYTKSYGEGGSDFWLLKYGPRTMKDTLNRTITYAGYYWNKTYGGPEDEVAKCVIQTIDGGFAIAGYINSSLNGLDVWLVKTDSEGTMEWNVSYGGIGDETANSVIQTKDGGYLLAGYVSSNDQSENTFVIKTDAFGNTEWAQKLPGQGSNSIIESLDGNYALAVRYPNSFGLVKVNASGLATLSESYTNSADIVEAKSIIQADDGGFVIAGWTQINSSGTLGTWLVKTDSYGVKQWDRSYEKLGAYAIIRTIDGNYAMTGDRASIIVTDTNGNLLLSVTHDGETGDGGKWFSRTYSITETIENHFYMAGTGNGSGEIMKYQAVLIHSVLASDDTPPTIAVLSPENGKTYPSDNVPLTVFVSEPARFLWYSLDGQNATLSGNTTLPTLTDGSHSITVYARDTAYNTGKSEPVLFNSETIYFTIDSALTIAPPDDTPPTDHDSKNSTTEPLPTIPIATITIIALVATCAIYYRKHETKNN